MGNKSSHPEDAADSVEDHTQSPFQTLFKMKSPGSRPGSSSEPRSSGVKFSLGRKNSTHSGSEKDPEESLPDFENYSTPMRNPSKKHPEHLSKLSKALITLSQGEENANGISLTVFTKFICQNHTCLGFHLYEYFLSHGKNASRKPKSVLCKEAFISCAQKIMDLMGDSNVLEYYVSVFAKHDETVTKENFCDFVQSCYLLSRGGRSELVDEDVTKAVMTAVFHNKQNVSSKYVTHWLQANCPRIVNWLHRYLVHRFTVGYRLINEESEGTAISGPLNLDTPVLETCPTSLTSPKRFSFDALKPEPEHQSTELKLDPMQIWLLAASLPVNFTKPQPLNKSPSGAGLLLMDPHSFITMMIASQTPTNWVPLYNSDIHGISQNRFLHHVLGYRASTVLFLRGDEGYLFCVAIDGEWKDSNHFWGGPDCTAVQISPQYHVLDKGAKLLYYNTSIRGYPYGFHVGMDHKNPVLEVDKDLTMISYRKIPLRLHNIEVWGCGSQQHKEAQNEFKRWELKQVEKSRDMKLNAADWSDHPDKYLLDLAGNRPNYSEYKAS